MFFPVLTPFAHALVRRLVADGAMTLTPGASEAGVAERLAGALGAGGEHRQLVPAVAKALVNDAEVDELFIDDEALGELVGGLGPGAIRRA